MRIDKLTEVRFAFIALSIAAVLFGKSYCQTFTIHPGNITIDTLHDQIVEFTCSYTTTSVQPQWLVVAEGGLPQALSFPASFGLYSYHTATPTLAQVSVRALAGTPGLNNTCFSCRFINTGLLESRRGCLIIASPPLKPIVSVSEIRFNSISLKWDAPWSPLPIQNYTLELQNFEGVRLSTTTVPRESLTYTVTGLVGATRYRFRLRANSNAGSGTWSDAISEETALNSNPSALSIEVIGIIIGCILAAVAIIVAVIVVIAIVCCW